ncbi:MAG: glycoside hydrolase family 3 C-terminal domain-containing protein [Ruminococcus sp.]|nr:glycoside hydrolase family 3 C-terminal domain-containing protein [Ruminococcus sp.]MCD7799943.1 glycoside hydrolase family 3 C-terminal domain-containing protein [Ruminococcus sp.]
MIDVKELVSKMTLEEKASMCSGGDFWHTKSVERLGIPNVMLSDGPHGLRKQDLNADHLGINVSIKAVCFPSACATACSFDKELIETMGKALGNECLAEDVSTILGPGCNIKRSPLCGRNFEYFSEDPYLASNMAKHHILGVQSTGIATSLKHFLANNQEHRRMSTSANIDERTLREIYLCAFETAIKEAQPKTVMCSYNRINGTFASENKRYLTDILRDEWGFKGLVVSDWGAVNNRIDALKAGLDLEMPSSGGVNDRLIIKAVKDGNLSEEVLNTSVERILTLMYQYLENRNKDAKFDMDSDHALAEKIAQECIVLLKNDDNILPLQKGKKIAYIGKFAKAPRYQGGGSSHINSYKVSNALDSSKDFAEITYAQGYDTNQDATNSELLAEAIEVAKDSDVAVIFAGLPDTFESEGFDRSHMDMPNCQNQLIEKVAEVQPNTVVVLHNGSVITMPWLDKVKGVVETYLTGQGSGSAVSKILFGEVNPSGKLAETFPIKLQDNPSYLTGFGEGDEVNYSEGIFVGYRYYDKKDMDVLFPFGYGLSYTTFEYSNLQVSSEKIKDIDTLTVTVDITNTGSMAGKEIVQLYVQDVESSVIRPIKELKGFEKVSLEPNETKTVTFTLNKRSFAYYNVDIKDWHVESGEFRILIGKSSRDIVLTKSIYVESSVELPKHYHMNTTYGDLVCDPNAKDFLKKLNNLYFSEMEGDMGEGTQEMMLQMLKYNPLRAFISFTNGKISSSFIEENLKELM